MKTWLSAILRSMNPNPLIANSSKIRRPATFAQAPQLAHDHLVFGAALEHYL
jgi:hypothetical protein